MVPYGAAEAAPFQSESISKRIRLGRQRSGSALLCFQFLGRIQVAEDGARKSGGLQLFRLDHVGCYGVEQHVDAVSSGVQSALCSGGEFPAIDGAQRLPGRVVAWN